MARTTFRLGLGALCLLALLTAAHAATIERDGLSVGLDEATGSLTLLDAEAGAILGPLSLGLGGPDSVETDADGGLRGSYPHGVTVEATIGEGARVRLVVTAPVDGTALAGPAAMGPDPILGWARDERAADRGVLTMTLGHAAVGGASTLFDRERDLALTVTGDGASFVPMDGPEGYGMRVEFAAGRTELDLRVQRHYYRDTLGIRYYAPIRKRSYWRTAPCLAMTWYGIRAYETRPAQTRERLLPEMDWVRDHLLPYDRNLVFQLDDNYPEEDDAYLRGLSDEIRARGMIPGVWFTPYTVAPNELEPEHPSWFLHGPDGAALNTFGGISFHNRTLNVGNEEAVREWFGRWWEKVCNAWGFDFFKIDGQPDVIGAYARATDAGGIEAYREGLRIGRGVVGEDRFINGCWGTPVEGIGIMNGARTGPDTGDWPHATDVVIRWNYLNNTAWWCDPDAAANLARATVERTRLNTQVRSLTGQQFLTDDQWTSVPAANAYVWQRAMPSLDIRPANLYQIEDWQRYDVFDLKISKSYGQWDVVGLSNYDATRAERRLDLSRLGLPAGDYHVYDYWAQRYLGRLSVEGALAVALEPYEGKLYAIRPAEDGRPQLLSTSRHLSQGGLDLEALSRDRHGDGWVVGGVSTHIVAGDPYSLSLYAGSYRVAEAHSSAGEPTVTYAGPVVRVTLPSTAEGRARWSVRFVPRTGGGVAPATPDVDLGTLPLESTTEHSFQLVGLGPRPAEWTLDPVPAWYQGPTRGMVGAAPAEQTLRFRVATAGLPSDTEVRADLSLRVAGDPEGATFTVRFRTALPENLARRAEVTASSAWSPDYAPGLAADGDPATRWNSGQGERDGSWLQLAWTEPTEFDTLIIDEAPAFGTRVRQWSLQADDGSGWREVTKGTQLGVGRRIELAGPVRASRLRLTMTRSSETPTITEFAAYRRGR